MSVAGDTVARSSGKMPLFLDLQTFFLSLVAQKTVEASEMPRVANNQDLLKLENVGKLVI